MRYMKHDFRDVSEPQLPYLYKYFYPLPIVAFAWRTDEFHIYLAWLSFVLDIKIHQTIEETEERR